MTAKEMKIKTFSLIEEYYPERTELADDQDVIYKINGVINSIMLDLMKYRKIPAKYSYTLNENNKTLALSSIPDFYQLNTIPDIEYNVVGNIEIIFNTEDLELPKEITIYYYKYPSLMDLTFEATSTQTKEEVSAEYDESFEIELDLDLQEIMPYGIASDLLKNDMISGYGRYFYERYSELKGLIDSRKTQSMAIITGGIDL
ncbi:MAG TPA: hypothetical protein IAB65_06270 [Candidatus Onthocola stercorigallinarum]|nr:hypothetical protein [Candidatus Onthocola stercorigallinarum]